MLPLDQGALRVLVEERRRAIVYARRPASSLRLRRRAAVLIYAVASRVAALGAVVDDEPGTVRA
ncbi:MAG: hypothetical protein JOZ24_06780 [Candidatus Eremiobacteraeota bacterium]|nr:hypothetical protein [Candidatus Eremiobacteraeota bacterium]